MRQLTKKLFQCLNNLGALTCGALVFMLLLALPWWKIIDWVAPYEVLGIPVSFVFAVFLMPIALLYLVSRYIWFVENIDRHTQELENE